MSLTDPRTFLHIPQTYETEEGKSITVEQVLNLNCLAGISMARSSGSADAARP